MYRARRVGAGLALLIVLLGLLVPAGMVRGAPESFRKELVLGNIQEPAGLNALTSVASTEVQFMPLFTAYSFLRNDRFEQVNEYVTQVPTLSNGRWKLQPDGHMDVTWKLHPGMTWHDGRPFTAEDFLFTWNVYRDQRAPLGTRPALEDIESVLFPDPLTIVVRYRRPSSQANLLWLGAFAAPLPRHVVAPMLQRVGIEREVSTQQRHDLCGANVRREADVEFGSHPHWQRGEDAWPRVAAGCPDDAQHGIHDEALEQINPTIGAASARWRSGASAGTSGAARRQMIL